MPGHSVRVIEAAYRAVAISWVGTIGFNYIHYKKCVRIIYDYKFKTKYKTVSNTSSVNDEQI